MRNLGHVVPSGGASDIWLEGNTPLPLFRYRVVAEPARKRMTTQQAPESQPNAAPKTKALDGLESIV